MRILAFILLIQVLPACRQGAENVMPLEASIAGKPANPDPETPASNILFQSDDSGQSWQDISAGLPKTLEPGFVFVDNGRIWLGARSGLYRSTNPPATEAWERDMFLDERINGFSPGMMAPYIINYGQGFFQEIPGTGIWTSPYASLEDKKVITLLEISEGVVFVGTDNGLYKSADGGNTWKTVFSEGFIRGLTASEGVLLACGNKGIFRSTDGGEHWSRVSEAGFYGIKTGVHNGRFIAIVENQRSRLCASSDGGQSWQYIDGGLPQNAGIYDVEQLGDSIFCSTDAGIYRSSDEGQTWELVRESTNPQVFYRLTVSNGVLYALKAFGGC